MCIFAGVVNLKQQATLLENRYAFEDFVAATVRAESDEQLFSALTLAVGAYGYDKIIFSVFHDPRLPTFTHHIGIYQHQISGWNEFYAQKNYAVIDPVAKLIRAGAPIFAWDQLPRLAHISRAQQTFMSALSDFGLHQGIAVPVGNNKAVFGLSSSIPSGATRPVLEVLDAICNQAYPSFRRIHGADPSEFRANASLTNTEKAVLLWIASGKTDDETGVIMGSSVRTVDAHLRNIFRKLDVNNRVSAVVKGIHCGYIDL